MLALAGKNQHITNWFIIFVNPGNRCVCFFVLFFSCYAKYHLR